MSFIVILSGAVCIGVVYVLLKTKHRMIWRKLWQLDKELTELRNLNINLRKQVCLQGLTELRLQPKMPSQHGEDLWLWEYFGGRRTGFFVEVGAYDGVNLSNTYFLEAIGWNGVLVEPNPRNAELCGQSRPFSKCINAAVVKSPRGYATLSVVQGDGLDTLSYTTTRKSHIERIKKAGGKIEKIKVLALTLTDVLRSSGIGEDGEVDVLSVDVEGSELDVLQSLDYNWIRPLVVIVEDNTHGRDRSVESFMVKQGYKKEHRLSANVIYVRNGRQSVCEKGVG